MCKIIPSIAFLFIGKKNPPTLHRVDGPAGRGSGGRKSPSGVQRRSPGGGLGAKPKLKWNIKLKSWFLCLIEKNLKKSLEEI
jgi:hypothetical protein